MATKPDVQKWIGGHTETILCLDCSVDGKVLSGGEKGQSCLWSHDGNVIEKVGVGEIGIADVTSVCFSRKDPSCFYVASGEQIRQYDSRNLKMAMWNCEYNKEEINQIALNCNEELLASCDDSGLIRIINVREKKCKKVLRKHSNICTSVRFRSKRPWELISGGMDASVVHWESGRGRTLSVLNMQEIARHSNPSGGYMVNPPLVHSVDVSENDHLLACGLENASVELFEFRGKKSLCQKMCLQGHCLGVSQVHFPKFRSDDWLLSAGNDGKIILWDIANVKSTSGKMKDEDGGTEMGSSVSSQFQKHVITHGDKINWLTTVKTITNNFIFVADQSETISVYSLTH
ncbi:WD repeat-containing protein 53-like [Saccoglossus kowalevskii]|uniref:WD repeat-containing protein 53-like n=1 Tax=Saccoglossus kowalevskii TaxID=10224 RepID=A0ABM0GWK0_SACKO|nr:PREDICTED: WD repeat-containing protein 53-like [Saccoglossus kowalevskii]